MTTSESKGRFFYKTNRFESIRITNRIESIRIVNWNTLIPSTEMCVGMQAAVSKPCHRWHRGRTPGRRKFAESARCDTLIWPNVMALSTAPAGSTTTSDARA